MNKKQKFNKGFILLSKNERIAVLTLLSIITLLLGFSIFRPAIKLTKEERRAFHNLDSLIAIQEEAAEKATTAAMTPSETQENNTAYQKAKDKKASYNTPKKTAEKKHSDSKPFMAAPEKKAIPILDINTADSVALTALPQIAEVMGSRIHRYRERLGGFVSLEQLFEVRGMDSARFEVIKPYITLENKEIRKINVNQDEFKALLRHPYLEYEQVKAIVNHRERKGWIKGWKELEGLVGTVNPKLEKYVSY
ncbi:MAG: helix-hairpin-helix domain-containing protein [Bacteroidales bacterium]|nr:helix-hairpin-helix domain-containing protein [Bacteroidales bacterium]